MSDNELLYRYWGKAHPKTADKPQWHLLAYHSLDVAAVGRVYLERHTTLRHGLAGNLGLDDEIFLTWVTFFLAIHDLGKFAEGFQNLRCDLFSQLQKRSSNKPYSVRHDSLGFLFWEQGLWPLLEQEDWLGLKAGKRDKSYWKEAFAFWARAVNGHHGQPPQRRPGNAAELILEHHFSTADREAAVAFARAVRALVLPAALDAFSPPAAKAFNQHSLKISWLLAGIGVLADWIGSNVNYFPYEDKLLPLDEYWRRARCNAIAAMERVGVLPVPSVQQRSLGELFPNIGRFEPTPLQKRVAELPLGKGPQLFILEDVTGAGKTEAAVLLAHRLMAAGLGEGIYMGLPTMATSNAMYERVEEVSKRLFAAKPSLVLAHSARHLSAPFRRTILPFDASRDLDYAQDEQSASARCTAWLADGRKKSLLANVGVGTIDQALQSILCSKHQSLRLLGLFRKILIVDEVHACDAYMSVLLRTLLTFHRSMGGSAILLSATLPKEMRQEFSDAFCEGAGQPPPELTSEHYPLLTQVGGPEAAEYPLGTRPELKRCIQIRWLSAPPEGVEKVLLEAVEGGRCVCWIRNTVADARTAYTALLGKIPEERLELFHARFALGDRLAIERRVIERFGKDSTAEQRAGRVVIATQVVEQSLDLDFDLMISDLAPVDLLIQRAGRLCRHTRDGQGNPIDGPDQRGTPCLVVYGPEPVADAPKHWYSALFPGAAAVYPDHGQLWLTAWLLRQRGAFRMPEDARTLIEGVYGPSSEELMPQELLEQHCKACAEALADKAQGRMNSLDPQAGYTIEGVDWWSDALTPTRLGDPSSTVRLARWNGQVLEPWQPGEYAWDLSQLQVRQALIKEAAEPADPALGVAVKQMVESLPGKGKWSVLLPLLPEQGDLWSGTALDGRGNEVRVFYDLRRGLILERELEGQG